ncbi:MAG: chemotaxis protein CheA [Steroidobacteraceae bacterium]|nr:chemotaxis protein CheA [Deltaproteobacteria bacterium]
MDMSQYRDLFVSEARDHLGAFNGLIVRLEEIPDDKAAINELFRHAHSLKGMAATMMYDPIARLAHIMEDQLSRVRSGEVPLIPALADLLLEGSDALAGMIFQVESETETITDAARLVERLTAFDPFAEKRLPKEDPEEQSVIASGQLLQPPHQFRQTDSFKSIRIKTETLDQLVNIAGELITNCHQLAECARQSAVPAFDEPLNQLSGLLRDLRDVVLKARMVPFSFIAERFPRLVRDLARKQGKEITFRLDGKNIELDRGILEEIAEPLVHILRNAVDHGMETPGERVAAGKPSGGDIRLTVVRDKDHVEIVIADDGRGMDSERLKSKAVEKGLVTAEQASVLTAQESFMLVCSPGFSTAETVSDISGRGVGMDAVRSTVHSLGGALTIHSEIGRGSRFVLRLPITVSIIQALIVQSGAIEIAFPISVVTRTLELGREDIIDEAGQKMIDLDGARVPVRSLNRLLGQPVATGPAVDLLPAVVCEIGGTPIAFIADRLCGQHEIFVRPLGSPLSSLRGLGGATITGDGRVVFVVDAASLA